MPPIVPANVRPIVQADEMKVFDFFLHLEIAVAGSSAELQKRKMKNERKKKKKKKLNFLLYLFDDTFLRYLSLKNINI